ncbi:MAG: oxidoreductase [Firmicutes bacterium]|nr:oxidoreductase [Bacillota bacterium]MBO2520982.1 oxidoreductase [Bacillota bacterium]
MADAPFRFAIAGCGAISMAHIESIKKMDSARLVAVWSRTPERAQAVAREHGVDWEPTLEALAGRDDVDAVIVCTPSGFHLEPALAAIEAGKHVVVEKPLEVTVQRCRTIVERARARGVQVGVIFQSRFAPANQAAKRAVEEGRFGRIVMGDAYVKWYRPQSYYDGGAWRGTWELDGGGALMNQAIHAVDLLLWLMGSVESVDARADCLAHQRIEVEDTLSALLRFTSGAIGVIQATTSVFPGYPKRVEIHGDRGGVVLVDDAVASWYEGGDPHPVAEMLERYGARELSGAASDPMAISFDNHRRQLEDFVEAVRTGRPPLVDGEEGTKAVELVQAIYRAAQTGERVFLS